jgi:hypothetical protein
MCLRSPVVPFAVLRGVTSTHTSLRWLRFLPLHCARSQHKQQNLPSQPIYSCIRASYTSHGYLVP